MTTARTRLDELVASGSAAALFPSPEAAASVLRTSGPLAVTDAALRGGDAAAANRVLLDWVATRLLGEWSRDGRPQFDRRWRAVCDAMLVIASLPAAKRMAALQSTARRARVLGEDERILIARLTASASHPLRFADAVRNLQPLRATVLPDAGAGGELSLVVQLGPLEGHVTFAASAAAHPSDLDIRTATWVVAGTHWLRQWTGGQAQEGVVARLLGEAALGCVGAIGAGSFRERIDRFDAWLDFGFTVREVIPFVADAELARGLADLRLSVPDCASLAQQAFVLKHPHARWIGLPGGRLFVVADRPTGPYGFDNFGAVLPVERAVVDDPGDPGGEHFHAVRDEGERQLIERGLLEFYTGPRLTAEQIRAALDASLGVLARCDDGSILASEPSGRLVQVGRDGVARPELHVVIDGIRLDFAALDDH
jgi:hypothetical protein